MAVGTLWATCGYRVSRALPGVVGSRLVDRLLIGAAGR